MLTDRQRQAARHVAEGMTQRAAAAMVGAHESTLSKWRAKDEFVEELCRVSRERESEIVARAGDRRGELIEAHLQLEKLALAESIKILTTGRAADRAKLATAIVTRSAGVVVAIQNKIEQEIVANRAAPLALGALGPEERAAFLDTLAKVTR